MRKTITLSALAISLLAGATASAQSFSFKADRDDITTLGGIGPGGSQYVGAHYKGTYTSTFEGEATKNGTFECTMTSQPPGLFDTHAACTMVQDDGSFTSAWGCNALNAENTDMSCVAGLYGRSGRFENMVGSAAGRTTGDKSHGVGLWYKPGE